MQSVVPFLLPWKPVSQSGHQSCVTKSSIVGQQCEQVCIHHHAIFGTHKPYENDGQLSKSKTSGGDFDLVRQPLHIYFQHLILVKIRHYQYQQNAL